MGRLSCLPSCPRPFHSASQGPAQTRGVWRMHPRRPAPAPQAGSEPGREERSAPSHARDRARAQHFGRHTTTISSFLLHHPQRARGCCAVWQGGQRCQTPCAASGQPGCACSCSLFILQLKTTAPAGMILEPGSPQPREPCSSQHGGVAEQHFRRAFQE